MLLNLFNLTALWQKVGCERNSGRQYTNTLQKETWLWLTHWPEGSAAAKICNCHQYALSCRVTSEVGFLLLLNFIMSQEQLHLGWDPNPGTESPAQSRSKELQKQSSYPILPYNRHIKRTNLWHLVIYKTHYIIKYILKMFNVEIWLHLRTW